LHDEDTKDLILGERFISQDTRTVASDRLRSGIDFIVDDERIDVTDGHSYGDDNNDDKKGAVLCTFLLVRVEASSQLMMRNRIHSPRQATYTP